MSLLSFSDAEGQAKCKQTRRKKFLTDMDTLLPWTEMEKPIRRYYSKSLKGRKPFPLSSMLRSGFWSLFTDETVVRETLRVSTRSTVG
ncbi:hypothetical protein [Gynuella sunshinyii]|uniref:Transposase InsH N-terminal domain-containing protein n=1 Tax=Gynuella sunshinyii YC6258 TaxID=1445510 RepID=A0A0C5VKH2_9GAMM|nr:hypothetical protein [Gynuella sunshinyii]AJQ94756.1 hypothetical Protein YC6258_02718 [Gynuella sunshinyii YC6258]